MTKIYEVNNNLCFFFSSFLYDVNNKNDFFFSAVRCDKFCTFFSLFLKNGQLNYPRNIRVLLGNRFFYYSRRTGLSLLKYFLLLLRLQDVLDLHNDVYGINDLDKVCRVFSLYVARMKIYGLIRLCLEWLIFHIRFDCEFRSTTSTHLGRWVSGLFQKSIFLSGFSILPSRIIAYFMASWQCNFYRGKKWQVVL